MSKSAIAIILLAFSLAAVVHADVTIGDVRAAVIAALGQGAHCGYRDRPGGTVIWDRASVRTVRIAAGKAIGMGTRSVKRIMPQAEGWVVEVHGPFDRARAQKDWVAWSTGGWGESERIWNVDGAEQRYYESGNLLQSPDGMYGYGLILTCGRRCDRDVLRRFRTITLPAAGAAADGIDYEAMALPDNERDYWSLDYYSADNEPEGSDWDDNRREREDQGADSRGDQGE